MTAADKAKQEATGIVAALVKGATAQTEYGDLPVDAQELSEYARFQECTATPSDMVARGGAACKVDPPKVE